MIVAKTDDKRRLVMPPELPARSAVIVQQVDPDTWMVRRQKQEVTIKVIPLAVIKRLPDDLEWEAKELAAAQWTSQHVPEPEE